jgi:CheY-like chemotaxis protein
MFHGVMPEPTAQRLPPKRILVVEDELLVAETIRRLLVVGGHTAEIVHDGEQALALFEPGKYDLVITDFRLPNMDGLELAQAIKQRAPVLPIILITAHAEAIGKGMGKVSNVDFLIGKPFSVEQLQAGLKAVFPGAWSSSSGPR